MRAAVFSHLDDPTAAAKTTAEQVSVRYRGDHPEVSIAEERIKEDERRLTFLHGLFDRHSKAMDGSPLTREVLIGPRKGKLALFDYGLFMGVAGIGVLGSAVALTNVATYISDSAMIPSLTDNFPRALFFSAIPFSGSAVIKAFGANLTDPKAEQAFNLTVAKYACVFVATHIVALAIFFAPQKPDAAALAQALAGGMSPTNPTVAVLKAIASYVVLGSGLLSEMLIAPVVINYAHKLHRAGREIVVLLHDAQSFHLGYIDSLNSKINEVVERIGKARAELDRHASAQAEMTAATLYLNREAAADLKTEGRRAENEFFARRFTKGASK